MIKKYLGCLFLSIHVFSALSLALPYFVEEDLLIEQQELQKLSVLKSQMTQMVAANPSTRMSAAKLHQMEGKLERLQEQRSALSLKAAQHNKSRRQLEKKIQLKVLELNP